MLWSGQVLLYWCCCTGVAVLVLLYGCVEAFTCGEVNLYQMQICAELRTRRGEVSNLWPDEGQRLCSHLQETRDTHCQLVQPF